MKKLLVIVLSAVLLLSCAACYNSKMDAEPPATTNPAVVTDPTSVTEIATEETKTTVEQTGNVFEIQNISRITFFLCYGDVTGSDVPDENLTEITNWLASFTIKDKAPEILPPGTNAAYVEIEYADGTVIKQGLDTVTVDGVTYYMEHSQAPDCYHEILSHAKPKQ